ncbi:TIGR02449 family protein [Methylogaea oryzae]|uniref:TIGR02449 family protein n=1 Tax=Methylogaea oryzae TaxID=1295382 RepID=A0A8D4VU22_9GAMM|nr:TIGR02449 family protein [Methylogaea oryzae]BBL72642.1 hypothetical protein MoryE10_32480 [Methylogaea oryzae]
MTTENELQAELHRLDEKVDALLRLCRSLQHANQELIEQNEQLTQERAQLVEKAAMARNRVEAMVKRLRTLGQENL